MGFGNANKVCLHPRSFQKVPGGISSTEFPRLQRESWGISEKEAIDRLEENMGQFREAGGMPRALGREYVSVAHFWLRPPHKGSPGEP